MNEKKIAFIICHNDNKSLDVCIEYIQKLIIPEGFEIELIGSSDVDNIAEAYNCLMQESDAKYKVYLLPNVLIVDENFLVKLIDDFDANAKLGMLGVLGTTNAGKEDINWNSGSIYVGDDINLSTYNSFSNDKVLALNGVLLATQVDLTWNEDIACQDLFDVYHSEVMLKSGYQIDVLKSDTPICYYMPTFSEFEHKNQIIRDDTYITNASKEKLPLVSCIFSAYKAKDFLADTLTSIIEQSYQNLEIIVVDDCSNDGTADVIKAFAEKDSRIKPIIKTQNENVCAAENEAYAVAKGKYIALCGHDDIWVKNKIEHQVFLLERNDNLGVCFTLCSVLGDNLEDVSEKESGLTALFNQNNRSSEQFMQDLFFKGNFLCAPSAVIRRDIIGPSLYKVGLLQLQDYDLWMNLLTKADIYIIQERLTGYRRFSSENNLSSAKRNNINRLYRETQYSCYRLLIDMSDERFIHFFNPFFEKSDASTHEELMCERAIILKKMKNYNCVNMLMELMEDAKTSQVLKNKYGFGTKDLYDLTNETLLFDVETLSLLNQYKSYVSELIEEKGQVNKD